MTSLPMDTRSAPSKRPAPRGTAAYPRKRAVTACQVCRARRTKCDNAKPACSFCTKIGAQCVQSPADLSSFDPASLKILERLDDLEALLQIPNDSDEISRPPRATAITGDPVRVSDLLPAETSDILQWPFFAPSGHRASEALSSNPPASGGSASRQGIEDFDDGSEPDAKPVHAFFENVHVKNPILDELDARRLTLRLTLHGFDSSGESCLALLIRACGLISNAFNSEPSVTMGSPQYFSARSYFLAAQKRIGPLIAIGGLLAAQCLFLSGVFMATTLEKRPAWRFFAQALMCCQDFLPSGVISEEVDLGSQLSPNQQSIYWSAWKSELEMRLLVKPKDFREPKDAIYPPFFPTPPAGPIADQQSTATDYTQRQQNGWFFYLSEISLRRLLARITEEITEVASNNATVDVVAILSELVVEWEVQIEQWTRNLAPSMALSSEPHEDDICRWVLRGQQVNLYELIYWPFLHQAFFEPVSDGSAAQIGPSEAILGLANKALAVHAQRLKVNLPGLYHRHHGTVFMIETCTRSALMLLYSAAKREDGTVLASHLSMPQGWEADVKAVLEMNRHWAPELREAGRNADVIEASLIDAALL